MPPCGSGKLNQVDSISPSYPVLLSYAFLFSLISGTINERFAGNFSTEMNISKNLTIQDLKWPNRPIKCQLHGG